MSNKGLLSNLMNDEMRNISINENNTQNQQYRITQFNTEINEKYKNYINRPQTIKENLGIVFNDDSIAQSSLPRTPQQKITHEGLQNLDIEDRYLIISGEDRPWYLDNISTDENIFNFQVECGDISLLNGNQMLSAGIRHSLENVLSIGVSKVIIPNRAMENGIHPSSYPYLQVLIGGIENTSFGTNKHLDNVLAVMTPKIPVPDDLNNFKYLEFVNSNKQRKDYYTPKARLNKLDLSIRRYDGEQLTESDILTSKDIQNIAVVYYDTDIDDGTLTIVTNTFFNPSNFQTGDILKFNGYQFRETNLGLSECYKFNDFINRKEGHVIISTSKTDDYASDASVIFHNKIVINAPIFYSTTTGKKEKQSWFTDLITKTNIDDNLELDNSGKCINSSLQVQVLLDVKILNKHSSRLIKNIDSK
jgi:hypothetical protein